MTQPSEAGKNLLSAQNNLRIGDTAPNFQADTSSGKIDFYQHIHDKWAILFSHPSDFTPVCTTELGKVSKLRPEFDRRNVTVLSLSCDTTEHHKQWIKDIDELSESSVWYPIIADPTREISVLYGMLDQTYIKQGMPMTVRSVFLIDPNKKVRFIITYPASTGRNFHEILRVIDSIQMTDNYKVATPADWTKGAPCVVLPSIPTDQALQLFPKGVTVVRPWLRTTPDPSS